LGFSVICKNEPPISVKFLLQEKKFWRKKNREIFSFREKNASGSYFPANPATDQNVAASEVFWGGVFQSENFQHFLS
jgi:hypothetical protein